MAADIVVNAAAVGQVVTYVASGFLARAGYRWRFPGRDKPPGEVLLVSVVLSLPLVALFGIWPGEQLASQAEYVASLLLTSLALGYGAARLRDCSRVRGLLERGGHYGQPEESLWAQTLGCLSEDALVTVELKNGKRVAGVPRQMPLTKDDVVQELYLIAPQARGSDGGWVAMGAGLVIPLTEVLHVSLSEEPTGAEA